MKLALGVGIAAAVLSAQQTFKTQTDLVNFGVVVTACLRLIVTEGIHDKFVRELVVAVGIDPDENPVVR